MHRREGLAQFVPGGFRSRMWSLINHFASDLRCKGWDGNNKSVCFPPSSYNGPCDIAHASSLSGMGKASFEGDCGVCVAQMCNLMSFHSLLSHARYVGHAFRCMSQMPHGAMQQSAWLQAGRFYQFLGMSHANRSTKRVCLVPSLFGAQWAAPWKETKIG